METHKEPAVLCGVESLRLQVSIFGIGIETNNYGGTGTPVASLTARSRADMLSIMLTTTMVPKPVDVVEHVTSQFSSLDGVSGIVVKQKHPDEFEVGIYLSNFELKVRKSVYAQERALYALFPNYSFQFLVIDASERANATPVER